MTGTISYTVHGVARSSKIKATECGHIFNMKAHANLDNGCITAIDVVGTYATTGLGIDCIATTKAPAKTDEIGLILSVPEIYEDMNPKMQEESNFYNAQGDVVRVYELVKHDVFEISKECVTVPTDLAVGKYLAPNGTATKLVAASSAPTDTAFVGYVYAQAANGNFYVYVMKNSFDAVE